MFLANRFLEAYIHNTQIKEAELTERGISFVRFEVFTAVTMKNAVFWDVTPCGSCKN
jgi:hypothetical protein